MTADHITRAGYHDCPACPLCASTTGVTLGQNMSGKLPAGRLRCCACGYHWYGTADELAQAEKADAAYFAAKEKGEL